MDIDLLSKIVKEIILDKDEVTLPGIGSFVAEIVPSAFSDKGFTINPPYKRLYFRQRENSGDTSLVDFYAASNNLDPRIASGILTDFLHELRKILETKKTVVFPGLGRLRATKENYFFFVADENLDIYPEGFGLESISLKTHEEEPAEVSRTMAALRSILSPEDEEASAKKSPETGMKEVPMDEETASEDSMDDAAEGGTEASVEETVTTVPETEQERPSGTEDTIVSADMEEAPTEVNADHGEETEKTEEAIPEDSNKNTGETVPEDSMESAAATVAETSAEETVDDTGKAEDSGDKKKSIRKTIGWTVIVLAALALTALAAFIILAHIAPDFIDSLLYTPEELEIINR